MKKSHRRLGFTLVQLLVVITIIGILAGLSVPAIGTALDKAKQAADTANVRQLGIIFFGIANDEGGTYPTGGYGTSPTRADAGNTKVLFGQMLEDKDITDAKILKAASQVAYKGSLQSASSGLGEENIGWDYMKGLQTTDESSIPLFISRGAVGSESALESNSGTVSIQTTGVWKDKGMAVYYLGNSAEWLKARNDRVEAPVKDTGVIAASGARLITAPGS